MIFYPAENVRWNRPFRATMLSFRAIIEHNDQSSKTDVPSHPKQFKTAQTMLFCYQSIMNLIQDQASFMLTRATFFTALEQRG
mmetsp:Transcript_11233/g.32410  ORF Transcript_11233/g.32410 Transcript_11233/m.32410 type:complete len:83 (+) Transcript_11233:128-376(+)